MNSCISMDSLWELQSFSSDFIFLGFIFACTLIRTVMTGKGSANTAPLKGRSSTRHHRLHPSHRKQRSQGSRSLSAYHSTSWAHGLSLNCPSIFCAGGLRFQYQILNVSVIFHPPSTKKQRALTDNRKAKQTHTRVSVYLAQVYKHYIHTMCLTKLCVCLCVYICSHIGAVYIYRLLYIWIQ